MESRLLDLKARLKEEYKRIRFSDEINKRIRSLCSQIIRIQDSNTHHQWLARLVEAYERLINGFNTLTIGQLTEQIKRTEDETISQILTNLKIPSNYFMDFLNAAREESFSQSLDFIIPKFLTLYVDSAITSSSSGNSQITFIDFIPKVTKVFANFNLSINNFTRAIAKKCLCGARNQESLCTIDLSNFKESLETFFSMFFGSIQNYRFYVKVNRIYSECLEKIRTERMNQRVNIIPTSVRKEYQGEQKFRLSETYRIDPMGMFEQGSFRDDGMVLFGKHPDNDFVFPEDESFVDQVSLIIYNANNNLYLVDCSKRSYCAIKIDPQRNTTFKEGSLINLAKTVLFRIDKIEYEQMTHHYNASEQTYEYTTEDMRMHSSILFSCLEGPYKDNNFKITTKVKNSDQPKDNFMFGCGGGGEAPDIFIPRETGISRKHCEFRYDSENNWFLWDERSANGTFLLMKTFDEYNRKVHSRAIQLFGNNTSNDFAVILVNRYTFVVSKA
ncbi:hypothetical protein SteCoe_16440 [Stentor coeruleus]|uniref:FHA domain-containing protein n=1 Tax=Stentor coeruleus TaxID=5963 RepID=A0A1R2C1C5_9CILI|nr:hypothetical protein SteCoe_16440 [Stentor coeruleus]